MDTVLGDFDFTFAYLDAIVISSKTKELLREYLNKVFAQIREKVQGKGIKMRFLFEQNQISGTYHWQRREMSRPRKGYSYQGYARPR